MIILFCVSWKTALKLVLSIQRKKNPIKIGWNIKLLYTFQVGEISAFGSPLDSLFGIKYQKVYKTHQ